MVEEVLERCEGGANERKAMKRQIFAGGEVLSQECHRRADKRRAILRTALGLGASLPFFDILLAGAASAKTERPIVGDQFVFVEGEGQGEVVRPGALVLGGPQQLAYPMDPASKIVRDGSRLNQVVLVRLDPEQLSPDTQANAAQGVVAYSAICTHQGCDVSQWKTDTKVLLCVCHGSEFDPRDRAKVVAGPAPRRLAILPIKIQEGVLVVAGAFKGRVGFSEL
jgi:rieske iron-sulfur protein